VSAGDYTIHARSKATGRLPDVKQRIPAELSEGRAPIPLAPPQGKRDDVRPWFDLIQHYLTCHMPGAVSVAYYLTDKRLAALRRDDDIDLRMKLRILRDWLVASYHEEPMWRIRRIMRSAWSDRFGVEKREPEQGPELPRWSSSIAEIDANTNAGGFYGFTVVAGETGVGKSTIGLGSAINAALDAENRWKVIYFNAELDDATMWQMIQRKTNRTQEWMQEHLYPWFDYHTVGFGVTAEQIVKHALVGATHGKVLIAIDSINTLANKAISDDRSANYFQFMRDLTGWGMEARRESMGDVALLVMSETNKDGMTKGRGADYWADFVLNVRLATQDHDAVKIRVAKGRYSGRRDLGLYTLDWRRGMMVSEQEVVGDDYQDIY
jgi:hypothetical protein